MAWLADAGRHETRDEPHQAAKGRLPADAAALDFASRRAGRATCNASFPAGGGPAEWERPQGEAAEPEPAQLV
eukprot:4116370-Alexandrium_andersonii.AAC.1